MSQLDQEENFEKKKEKKNNNIFYKIIITIFAILLLILIIGTLLLNKNVDNKNFNKSNETNETNIKDYNIESYQDKKTGEIKYKKTYNKNKKEYKNNYVKHRDSYKEELSIDDFLEAERVAKQNGWVAIGSLIVIGSFIVFFAEMRKESDKKNKENKDI